MREGYRVREGVEGIGRRDALKAIVGGGVALGAARAVDNVLVGYGVVTGTNLTEQDLAAAAGERLVPTAFTARTPDGVIGYGDGVIRAVEAASPGDLESRVEAVGRDLDALHAGEYRFAFSGYDDFLDRVRGAEQRPLAVAAMRGDGFRSVDPGTLRRFIDGDPGSVGAVIEGLARGFREHSGYDFARYAAGSVQDNVIFGAADLRAGFESPTGFAAVMAGENDGLFCYEFTYRSVEAFHAVAPLEQDVPVAGAVVVDDRHKHVYTGLASAIREDGDLVLPMTFVDYTHSTLYDDLNLRGVMGEGVEAYDARHRATDIYWDAFPSWY